MSKDSKVSAFADEKLHAAKEHKFCKPVASPPCCLATLFPLENGEKHSPYGPKEMKDHSLSFSTRTEVLRHLLLAYPSLLWAADGRVLGSTLQTKEPLGPRVFGKKPQFSRDKGIDRNIWMFGIVFDKNKGVGKTSC